MINIQDFLSSNLIMPDLKVDTREEAIRALIDKIFEGKPKHTYHLSRENVYEAVMERENLQTTGIGNGLAFPHARIEGWGKFEVAMAISRKGIDFSSLDSAPVNFVFLMISSPEEPYVILQAMSTVIRFLSEMKQGEGLLKSSLTVNEILLRFKEAGIDATEGILAQDIARPAAEVVTLDTSIEDVTRTMHLKRFDILPVVDDAGKFQGEISCLDIFQYGMPDFFKQLSTISFVKHIDPFEKYFRIKGDLKVKDLVLRGPSPVKRDRTLLEVIFEMTVKQKSKLFVVEDDGTLSGVIDRFCIIDKILFF